ncbi:hypothetical protein SO802_028026 [Lithocarpus litseifolius]|uniref:Plastocyanin-like domain-containing protein n=1 Tax=Lithocarpus litseifolius TaxID=425828 RepID=A0AAW2BRE5_9ROSI
MCCGGYFWNGIQQRRNSWQDGVYGTNCPIRPGKNFTYFIQVKDQIGSYFYFHHLDSRKLLEVLVASESGVAQRFQFRSLLLLVTSPYWLGTGTR